jgi:hypothetical protein
MLSWGRGLRVPIVGLLTCSLLLSCSQRERSSSSTNKGQGWNQETAGLEYRLIQAELKLSQSKDAYLVLNFRHKQLELRLQGTVVWNYPLTLEQTETSELHDFSDRFLGSKLTVVRPILFKYLFAASVKTPDSVLAIISDATMFSSDLLQRTIPERFELKWSDDIVLDIRTDVVGKPASKWKNTIVDIRETIAGHLGDAHVIVKMPKDNAITLYRAAMIGLPTLILPATS